MIASFLLDPYSLSEANTAVECIFSRDFDLQERSYFDP